MIWETVTLALSLMQILELSEPRAGKDDRNNWRHRSQSHVAMKLLDADDKFMTFSIAI